MSRKHKRARRSSSSSTRSVSRELDLNPGGLSLAHTQESLQVPLELCREIARQATCTPGGYGSCFTTPFDCSEINHGYKAFLVQLKQNHRVKQKLCLVSQSWLAIAKELIFEFLFLQDDTDWEPLADGLEKSREEDEFYKGRGAGFYVRRLDICSSSWTPALAISAARIVRCCPNIQALAIGAGVNPIPEGVLLTVINAIFETCPRALHTLEWNCDPGAPSTNEMFAQLSNTSRLQSFFMRVARPYTNPATVEEFNRVRRVQLEDLDTLEIASPNNDPSGVLSVMAFWTLPILKRVVLRGQQRVANALPFFSAHGPQLNTLEFDRIGDGAEEVLQLCSNITEVVVRLRFADSQIIFGHKTVKRVGIRGLQTVELASYPRRCDAAESLKKVFPILLHKERYPSLEVVRLLDYEQTKFLEQKWRALDVSQWAFWVWKFNRVGVRIEDHEGRPLDIKFSQSTVTLPEEITA